MAAERRKMVIEVDIETGKLLKITGNGCTVKKGRLKEGKLKLDGKIVSKVPDHTLVFTHSSPGCAWYFFGDWWYYICT